LPRGDADFPGRWRAIKTAFAKALPIGEPRSPVMTSRGERGIWQRQYCERTIRDDRDFAAHMDYAHFNPVEHGLVAHPADWPYSSFHRCVTGGLYPGALSGSGDEPQQTGERLCIEAVETRRGHDR
jgi:putative transposase